jgi:Arc/MetJ-type ribon-helix-helix transcriptional regulator
MNMKTYERADKIQINAWVSKRLVGLINELVRKKRYYSRSHFMTEAIIDLLSKEVFNGYIGEVLDADMRALAGIINSAKEGQSRK